MRYNTPVYFQSIQRGEYDASTGDYKPGNPTEAKRYAAITDTGTETLQLIYGELKQGSLTIRLQRPFNGVFDRIRIGEGKKAKSYRVDKSRSRELGGTGLGLSISI